MNADLFDGLSDLNLQQICLDDGAFLLRGFAKNVDADLMSALEKVVAQSPFRHMITPGGFRMSVAMSNCGQVGWITNRSGYRYDVIDPETGSSMASFA
ncbi:MAG: 2OG-Fe(II) oxygenase superfamily protein [Candidatus Nitrotoga sp. MKT]|nr:MAG: 2OG-Fe(II) oxygenase superfamily protein [Candidatus Nitrotoga sp. MKT]